MNNKTMSRLIESGWTKARKIDITEIEDKLTERGFMLSIQNKEFLCKYGNLRFELPNRNKQFKERICVHFDVKKALGKNLYKESLEYLEDEYEFLNVDSLVPIGESENGNLLILCTSNNVFYGYADYCLIRYGENIDEMLDCLIGENKDVHFFD
ncbi:MAG: SUKH-3 domain-containing protein [Lachnospiraceae bacterium]|nr:SUKH-3 domain-containing protein [Lachnospiraceae bacterium]MDE6233068.1 SUKH-3 domain-containing protein [Lachnospiraceae bacterium]MDE6251124.1 SUKH-3 domain-containing protein [Lachnospiraceae bacterium]